MAHRKDKYVDHVLVRYTPKQAFKDAIAAIGRFFAYSNIKHGFKSVISGFREFFVFFFAMLLVQLLFWCPMLAMQAREATIKEEAYAAADYHVKIEGMSSSEWSAYYNSTFIITDTFEEKDRLYKTYEANKYVNGSGREMYELKILMREDGMDQSRLFMLQNPISGEAVTVEYSPRCTYPDEVAGVSATFIPIIIAMGLLGALILLVLYNIRINHYKFRYGVYMSFGADFEKLFQTAAWELFSIALLTFVPSLVLGLIIQIAVTASLGGAMSLSPSLLIWAAIWQLCVILLAVFPSVRILATKTPTSLIVAGDNSNYVSSPRVSFRIFRKSFPMHYELYGFWRFRRYYATLLVSAIVFSSLFLCGFFINTMVTASENTKTAEFSLTANSNDGIDPYLIEEIAEFEGVQFISWESSVDATAINAYVVLNNRQRAGISSKTVKTDGGYADNNYKYSRIDDVLYTQVTRDGGWEIEGDLSRVMNDPSCIAVSEYVNNSRSLNFKVGDTVKLAVFEMSHGSISYEVPDNKYILNQLLAKGEYHFVTVEIAAIVDTGDTDDRYMIAMGEELFANVVHKDISAMKADLFVSKDLTHQETEALYERIRSSIAIFDALTLDNLRSGLAHKTAQKSSATPAVFICASVFLLIAPAVWLFSQSMFGAKRKIENEMLSAFGATDADLGRLYLFSGGVLTVPATVATVILGWGITEFIYWLINEFLTSLGMGADFRYDYKFSLIGLLICIIVSAASAMLATYHPFLKWKKERDALIKKHLGE